MTGRPEKADILIVDDEVIIAADLELRLISLGYAVRGKATRADQALDLVRQTRPDLVLMDIVLQGDMDGIETAEILRDKYDTPVIFITAYADTERLERAKLANPFGYILKPFQDRDLKITLEMALYVSRVDRKRRKAEAELRDSEERFRSITEQMTEAVFLTDQRGVITYMSPITEEIFGYEANGMVGRHFSEFLSEESREKALAAFTATLEEGRRVKHLGLVIRHKDGHCFSGELTGRLYRQHGRTAGTIGVIRDITVQQQAQKALQDSEKRFRHLYESVDAGVIVLSADGVITDVNQVACDTIGYSSDMVVGKTIRDRLWRAFGEDGSQIFPEKNLTALAIENSKPIKNVVRGILLQGRNQMQWILVNVEPVFHPENRTLREVIVTFQDITRMKKAETELRESEARYKGIFHNTFNGIAVYRAIEDGNDFEFVDFNDRGEKIDNISRDDVIGQRLTEIFPGVAEFGLLEVMKKVWQTGRSEHFPLARYKDHRVSGWRENFIYRLPSEEIVAVYSDETERKQAEEELRLSESRIRAILGNMNLIGLMLDTEGKITFCNNFMLEMTGWTCEDVLGRNWFDHFLPPDIKAELKAAFFSKMIEEDELPSHYENEIITRTGGTVLVSWRNSVFRNSEGHIVGITSIGEDITERRQAMDALVGERNRLRTLLDNVAAAVVVHGPDGEIKTANRRARNLLGLADLPSDGGSFPPSCWRLMREDESLVPEKEYPAEVVLSTGKKVPKHRVGVRRTREAPVVWSWVSAHPLWGDNGKIDDVVVTFSEIE